MVFQLKVIKVEINRKENKNGQTQIGKLRYFQIIHGKRVFYGCYNRLSQSWWLNTKTNIFSHFFRPEV